MQEQSSETSKEASEGNDVVAQATNTESALAALTTAVSNLSIHSVNPHELSALQEAIAELKIVMKDRQAKSGSKGTVMAGNNGAGLTVSDLSTSKNHFDQLDQRTEDSSHLLHQEMRKGREEVMSLNDTVAKQSVLTGMCSDIRATNTQLKSLRELLSGQIPVADRIGKHDVEELRDSIASLRAEVGELKKN